MSFSLSVRPDVERAVIAEAQRQGISPQVLLDDILMRGLNAGLPEHVEATRPDVDEILARLATRPAPHTPDDLRPRIAPPPGSNGLEHVLGHWPGDESDAALMSALEAVE
jgi:hypothetical protein